MRFVTSANQKGGWPIMSLSVKSFIDMNFYMTPLFLKPGQSETAEANLIEDRNLEYQNNIL
jgi:hypothetical protein